MALLVPHVKNHCLQLCTWLIAVFSLLAWSANTLAGGTRPNVVIIQSDDNGYNDFGFSAALNNQTNQYQTPNLDALASQSVVFRQGYAAAPLCSPSRAGLLTGQYQERFGFDTNIDALPNPLSNAGTQGLSANETTIAQRLKGLGYSTGMVGKWHLGYVEGTNVPLDKGFDEFFGLWGGVRYYFSDNRPANMIRRGNDEYETQYRAEGNSNVNDPNGNDPVNGRYVTDAFGDEAASFVKNHAAEQDPFFLYFSPTASHDPYQAKQQDLALFSHIADSTLRTRVAMTYALDRNVGKVLQALDDPNGDGNTSDSVRDNTIVVFMNDNGGATASANTPFRSSKGFTYEGGIRVPFLIDAPGVQAGIFDAPVIAYDVTATVLAAAGGDIAQSNMDGVDLLPHLTGANNDRPHEDLFWRNTSLWSVRSGDMKLLNNTGVTSLFDLSVDPGEQTNLANERPEVVTELLRKLTHWEATLGKTKWGSSTVTVPSPYEHFVLRPEVGTGIIFSQIDGWKDAVTGNLTRMNLYDGQPNTTIEFPVKNTSNYNVYNNQTRVSGLPFMLNEISFTGNFTAAPSYTGGVGGLPMILTKNLNGDGPKIRLDATSSGTSSRFKFAFSIPLQLLDDLEISGNGTQDFLISSNISDFDAPQNVTKTGTSKATLSGNNSFGGNLTIVAGQIFVTGASAAINGADAINIGSAGKLVLDSGAISVNSINNSSGGQFDFHGGLLQVVDFNGDLVNNGGNYSPGAPLAASTIYGNYSQNAASKLTMELGGTLVGLDYDQLLIAGDAALAGTLQIKLLNDFTPQQGDIFSLIYSVGGISGTFANSILPALPGGLSWRLAYSPNMLELIVGPPGGTEVTLVPGDYNGNGIVDAADYVVWRKSLGSTTDLAADGDKSGTVDANDLDFWRARFGNVAGLPLGTVSSTAVPEPNSFALILIAGIAILVSWSSIATRCGRAA